MANGKSSKGTAIKKPLACLIATTLTAAATPSAGRKSVENENAGPAPSHQTVAIPRPSANITPDEFWREWLPPVLAEFAPLILEHAGPLEASLSVRITGAGGGDWSGEIRNGGVSVRTGLDPEATLTLTMNERDFIAAVAGRHDDLLPWPGGLSGEFEPAWIAAIVRDFVGPLKQVEGALLFRAEHPDHPFVALLNFPGGYHEEPDATVSIDQNDLRLMKDWEFAGPEFVLMFMKGKIRVQNLMALIVRFSPLASLAKPVEAFRRQRV